MKAVHLLLSLFCFNLIHSQEISIDLYGPGDLETNFHHDVVKIDDGFVIANSTIEIENNFHNEIRLVKLDEEGLTVWSKLLYSNIGEDSFEVESIEKTADNGLTVIGTLHPDNIPPYRKIVIRLNENAEVVWAKEFSNTSGNADVISLPDSTFLMHLPFHDGWNNRLILAKLGPDGEVIAAFDSNLPYNSFIHEAHVNENSLDLLFNDGLVLNLSHDLQTINWSRKYYHAIGITMNRTANGDLIFASAQVAFPGYTTVFRTSGEGELIWAKYIEAWHGDVQDQGTIFDIVGFHFIAEDSEGNINCLANSEGGANGSLRMRLDAEGNYLSNSKISSIKNKMKLIDDEGFYFSGFRNNFSDSVTFESRSFSGEFPCDTELSYSIQNGTDSAWSFVDTLQLIPFELTSTPISISSETILVNSSIYCESTSVVEALNEVESSFTIYPNPASDVICIEAGEEFDEFVLYNSSGKEILRTREKRIDVNEFSSGFYNLTTFSKDSSRTSRLVIAH